MGSYSGQIIQMPNQSPFDIMQNPLINAYASAMLKKKFSDMEETQKESKRTKAYDKYKQEAIAKGLKIKEKYGPEGPSFETTEDKPLEKFDYEKAASGLGAEDTFKRIAGEMSVSPTDIASVNPNAAMSLVDGGVGDVSAQPIVPTSRDTRDYVSGALGKIPAFNKKTGGQINEVTQNLASRLNSLKDAIRKGEAGQADWQEAMNDLDSRSEELAGIGVDVDVLKKLYGR